MKVIGGGAIIFPSSAPVALTQSVVVDLAGSGWLAQAQETTAYTGIWAVHARVICANVSP